MLKGEHQPKSPKRNSNETEFKEPSGGVPRREFQSFISTPFWTEPLLTVEHASERTPAVSRRTKENLLEGSKCDLFQSPSISP